MATGNTTKGERDEIRFILEQQIDSKKARIRAEHKDEIEGILTEEVQEIMQNDPDVPTLLVYIDSAEQASRSFKEAETELNRATKEANIVLKAWSLKHKVAEISATATVMRETFMGRITRLAQKRANERVAALPWQEEITELDRERNALPIRIAVATTGPSLKRVLTSVLLKLGSPEAVAALLGSEDDGEA